MWHDPGSEFHCGTQDGHEHGCGTMGSSSLTGDQPGPSMGVHSLATSPGKSQSAFLTHGSMVDILLFRQNTIAYLWAVQYTATVCAGWPACDLTYCDIHFTAFSLHGTESALYLIYA